MPNLENQRVLHFSSSAKRFRGYTMILISSYSAYIYLQNCISVYDLIEHVYDLIELPLFQKMSVKIYTNFFLSSERYKFKINYSNDTMRHGM